MGNSLDIPAELDTMAALNALVAAAGPTPIVPVPTAPIPKEDLPQTSQIIPDKDYSGPQDAKGATIAVNDPLFISPAPAPKTAAISIPSPIPQAGPLLAPAAPGATPSSVPAASPVTSFPATTNPARLFFTGRTGVGKDYLAKLIGATVLDINAPLLSWAKEYFSGVKMQDLTPTLQTIKAWGDGVIDKNYPITPTRWLFLRWAQSQSWGGGAKAFGTPGFWMNLLILTANETQGVVAITSVNTPAEYSMLKAEGFTHFHVMTSPSTYMQRTKRQGANDALAGALDADAIKKVSAQRQGEKLPVVWNDNVNPPSARIWSLEEWKQSFSVAPVEQIASFE